MESAHRDITREHARTRGTSCRPCHAQYATVACCLLSIVNSTMNKAVKDSRTCTRGVLAACLGLGERGHCYK